MATKLGTIYTDFTAKTVGFEQGVSRVKSKGGALQGDLKALAGVASRVFAGFSAALAVKEMIDAGEAAKRYQGQLSLVVDESIGVAKAQRDLFNSAQATRTEMGDNVALYAKLARATDELGVSHERLVGITETLNKAGVVSAATAEEQRNAIRQLGQALQGGVLRAEEYNSINEQTPRIMQAIADGMGIAKSALRSYALEGKITSKDIVNAIENQASVIDKEFKKMPVTIDQAATQFSNSLDRMIVSFTGDKGLNAVITDFIQSGTEFTDWVTKNAQQIKSYLLPVYNTLYNEADAAVRILIAGVEYMKGNTDIAKQFAIDASESFDKATKAIQQWGVVTQVTIDNVKQNKGSIDLGKLLFGDKDPAEINDGLTKGNDNLKKIYSTLEAANNEIYRLNDVWQNTDTSVEAYTEAVQKAAAAYNDFQTRTPDEEARLEMLSQQEELIRSQQSALENAQDSMVQLDALRQAGQMSDIAYYEQALAIIDKLTKADIIASHRRTRQAQKEYRDKAMLANNALFAIEQFAELSGKRSFAFIKKLRAAQALINAYTAATSAGSESGIGAIGVYLKTLGFFLQAVNAINSTSIDGGGAGGGASGGGVDIPAQTLPTRQETPTNKGNDKVTVVLIGGSGTAQELTDEMAEQFLNYTMEQINSNGKKIIERDSPQALEIAKAVNR